MLQERELKLIELREMIAEKEGRILRGSLPSSTLTCGIPKGAISEIAGHAKIEWVSQFLSENPSLNVFWAEATFTLLPTALSQRGLCLNRLIFAECGEELLQSLRKALSCRAFQCIVAPNKFPNEKTLKALQLLTEKSNTSLLLLSDGLKPQWPICLQIEVHQASDEKSFEIGIKKNKRSNSIEPSEAL